LQDKKIGRPTNNPKKHRITVRLDDGTYMKLTECCEGLDLNVSEVICEGVDKLYQTMGRTNRKK
jgi:hypothetical protein